MTQQKSLLFSAAALFLLWFVIQFFTVSWAMPSLSEPVADAIPPNPAFSARQMMEADTNKYGPMQYLILGTLFPAKDTAQWNDVTMMEQTTLRIKQFRTVTAVMNLGIAFLIWLTAIYILQWPPLYAFTAGAMLILTPLDYFYSATSNMDIPCVFYFTAAIFFVLLAETKKKTLYHLPAGLFLAFAFCTKDQVYAQCILPAILFAIFKYRQAEKDKLKTTAIPFLYWLAGFVPGVIIPYLLIGGWQVAKNHFLWITGSGQQGYQQVSTGLYDRVILFCSSLTQCFSMLDLALILALAAVLLLLGHNRLELWKKLNFSVSEKWSGIFLLAAFLSFQIFFVQVTRFTHDRYMLFLLPWLILTVLLLLKKIEKKQVFFYITIPILLLQGAVIFSLNSAMHSLPFAELRKAIAENPNLQQVGLVSVTASKGAYYQKMQNGNIKAFHSIRHWAQYYTIPGLKQADIYPAEPYLLFMNPACLMITEKQLSDPAIKNLLNVFGYTPAAEFRQKGLLPLTFFKNMQTESLYLFARTKNTMPQTFTLFAKADLHWQLAQLTDLLQILNGFAIDNRLIPVGKALAPFTAVQDIQDWNISPDTLLIAMLAYRLAGRDEDAKKMQKFILQVVPDGAKRLNALPPQLVFSERMSSR